ncbi:MOSC domain-containing protein [Sphingomonas sp. 1P06PA]|uniref:MOSC domain-containing protein n=1 Tax=Sphingomonas sp. 1P06PA TaxID=554121 RepID=UPI0039A67390
MTGRLIGIARHGRPRGPIETIDRADVSIEEGIRGDYRGAVKPGGRGKRQVTVLARADWEAAIADLGTALDWSVRRANLLVDGIGLPRTPGTLLRVGHAVVLEVTGECDPCSRMDEIAPGLRAALTPEWRGGLLTRVIAGGQLAIGDEMRIEA